MVTNWILIEAKSGIRSMDLPTFAWLGLVTKNSRIKRKAALDLTFVFDWMDDETIEMWLYIHSEA